MSASLLQKEPLLPSSDRDKLNAFADALITPGKAHILGPEGETIDVPPDVYDALVAIVKSFTHNKALTLAPVSLLLSTQEVAEFLGVSRPTVVKLLTEGQIPFQQAGERRHRKVALSDALAYQEKISFQRSEALGSMVRHSEEAGLYEQELPADYADDVKAARRELAS